MNSSPNSLSCTGSGGERGGRSGRRLRALLVLECMGVAFSPSIVAVVCFIRVVLSEIDNSEELIEKIFDKSLWTVNDNF
jgi:hypothetical protein